MNQKPNSTPEGAAESAKILSREEFMEELWARLQKVKQHLYFKNPVAPHDPAIAVQYRNLENLQLIAGIEKGDLSTYALDELIFRLEHNEFSVEALMELLPHSQGEEPTLETAKKMVLNLIARRINNAASFAGHKGIMGKNNTFLYPSRAALADGIKDMIKCGLVTEQELLGIANNNTVVSVIKDAVEERPAKILAFVVEKLETMGECFGQKKPLKAEEIRKSEVLEIKTVKDLMKYLETGGDFIVALTMVIRLIKEGKIKPEKFLTETEKEALFQEPANARIAYIDALAMKRINLLAVEAIADMCTGSRILSDRLILLIDELLRKKLLDEDKFYSEITPELKQIIMGGHVDLEESERVTLPRAQESSPAAFGKEPTMKSLPAFINAPTPEDIVKATKEKLETAPERDKKIEARRKKENCQVLHIGPKEDPETVPIAWRGWVISLVNYDDKQRSSLRPMLISSRTFGSHPACTDELVNPERDTIKPKYNVKEFMAEIEPHRDNPDILLINWIGGHVQVRDENGNLGTPKTNPIEVTEGDMVRIGRYDIHIIGKDHAFTPATLLPYAKDLIDQAVERIFESERTTPEQDRRDHENIERLIQLNVASIPGPADGKDESLREYAAKWYKKEFSEIWEKLQLWSNENPVFDAKDFPTLQMLLDLREEPGTFVPDFGVSAKDIKAAAKKRIDRYLAAGATAYPDHLYHPLNVFGKIVGKIKEVFSEKARKEKQKVSTREKNIADLGLIEIAKFILETELFDQEDVTLEATDAYAAKIEENIRIRKLFDILEHEYEQSDLVRIIGELRILCAGKKLCDIFTDEEIAIKDLNLELTLSAEESVEKSYIAQKALFIARRAFRSAQNMAEDLNTEKDDPAGLEEKLNLLDKILSMNLFKLVKLNYDIGNIQDEMQIRETINKMREKVEMAKTRIIEEAEKAKTLEDSHREYLRVLHQKHIEIIKKAGQVRATLAAAELTVETFENMTDLCAVVANPVTDEIAGKLALKVEYEKHETNFQVRKSGGLNDKKCNAGIGRVTTKKYTETWEEIKHNWWKKYEEVGAYIAGLVMSGDERTPYLHGLLKHAMEKKYLNSNDIGYTEVELARGMQKFIEKKEAEKKEQERILLDQKWKDLLNEMNQWRTEILSGDDDDFDYLDQEPFFAEESNAQMKERLYQLRGQITATKIGRCLEHIKANDRAYYFKKVALEAAEKDVAAIDYLDAQEFDLLQYGK